MKKFIKPGKPLALSAESCSESVVLKWQNGENAQLSEISVADKNGTFVAISTVEQNVFTVDSLTDGKEYTFGVRSVAESGGKTAFSDYAVVFCTPETLELTLDRYSVSAEIGETIAFVCLYDGNSCQPVWKTENEDIADIDENGVFIAKANGTAKISATCHGKTVSAKICVGGLSESVSRNIPEKRYEKRDGIYVFDSGKKSEAVLCFAGDLMCAAEQKRSAFSTAEDSYDFCTSFTYLKEMNKTADFCMANADCQYAVNPLRNEGAPAQFFEAVRFGGFDAVFCTPDSERGIPDGVTGPTDSQTAACGLINSRTDGKRFFVAEINGIKISIYTYGRIYSETQRFSPKKETDDSYCAENFASDMESAKQLGAEYHIVCIRWGSHNLSAPSALQTEAAAEIAELGADLIIGGRPHVVQSAETIQTKSGREVTVVYSLGNTVTSVKETPDNRMGALLRVSLVKRRKGGVFATPGYVPIAIIRSLSGGKYVAAPVLPSFMDYGGSTLNFCCDAKDEAAMRLGGSIPALNENDSFFDSVKLLNPDAKNLRAYACAMGTMLFINWESTPDADGYRLFKKRKDGSYTGVTDTENCYIRVGRPQLGFSSYKVKAFHTVGDEREYIKSSDIVTVEYLPKPSEIVLKADYLRGNIALSWNATANADGYRLFKKQPDGSYVGMENSLTTGMTVPLDRFDGETVKIGAFKLVNGERIVLFRSEELKLSDPMGEYRIKD